MPSDEKWRAAIQRHINAAKNLGEDTPMIVGVRRDQLKAHETKQLIEFLNMLLTSSELVRAFEGRVGFDLEGFENEKRDPEDIPEVKNYLRAVSAEFPYWFWFMEMKSPRLKLLLHCLCDAELRMDIHKEHVLRAYSRDDLAHFMTQYGRALDELTQRFGLSDVEVTSRLKQVKDYYKKQGISF